MLNFEFTGTHFIIRTLSARPLASVGKTLYGWGAQFDGDDRVLAVFIPADTALTIPEVTAQRVAREVLPLGHLHPAAIAAAEASILGVINDLKAAA